LCVLTRLTHGCPLPALVAAFARDESTVASWSEKAGAPGAVVQQQYLQSHQLYRQHVQADQLYAKRGVADPGVAVVLA
jgi:hypothetical protein